MSNGIERHEYRVEVRVPRVAREGTTWRTITPPTRYETAHDVGVHLAESLVESGFDAARVDAWLSDYVRYVEYEVTTTRQREIPMRKRS